MTSVARPRHRLVSWLLSSGGDALGRLVIQLLATVVLARLLTPEEFGLSALAITLMTVLSMVVGAPLEEALVQRRIVRRHHYEAALAAGWALAAPILLLLLALGADLDSGQPGLAVLIAGASLTLATTAPTAALQAVARRQQRFGVLAQARFGGQALGSTAGVLLALAGAGAWSLIAIRVLAAFGTVAILQVEVRHRLRARWSRKHLHELAPFATLHLADRLAESLASAALHWLASAWYGVTAVGYLNLALRIIEPLRGAVGMVGHNLAFSYFARLQDTPAQLAASVRSVVGDTALAIVPTFTGIAACAMPLVLLLAGPGWEIAAVLVVLYAAATALVLPFNFVHSALSAAGRPGLGFLSSVLALAVQVVTLLAWRDGGAIGIGWALLATGAVEVLVSAVLARRVLRVSATALLGDLAPTLACATGMAVAVSVIEHSSASLTPALRLALEVPAGVAVYAILSLALNRTRLQGLYQLLTPAASRP